MFVAGSAKTDHRQATSSAGFPGILKGLAGHLGARVAFTLCIALNAFAEARGTNPRAVGAAQMTDQLY
jgi:hypothetical protein